MRVINDTAAASDSSCVFAQGNQGDCLIDVDVGTCARCESEWTGLPHLLFPFFLFEVELTALCVNKH